jgi:hypothetical protein
MRRWLWVGVLGVGLLVSACAGPGQAPKTGDLLFPLPYLIKNHGSGKASTPAPEGVEAQR